MNFRRFLHVRTAALIVMLTWLATGCYVPIKQVPMDSRGRFQEVPESFENGKTTRTDVLLVMGEPDDASPDETLLTYRSATIDGVVIVTQCTPPVEFRTDTEMRFRFDEQGLLRDIEISRS